MTTRRKTYSQLRKRPMLNAKKAYREKQKSLENKRLNMTLDKDVADKLADMVDCFDDTQKAIMQRLIIKEYNRMYGVKNSKLKQYTENKGVKKHSLFGCYALNGFTLPF